MNACEVVWRQLVSAAKLREDGTFTLEHIAAAGRVAGLQPDECYAAAFVAGLDCSWAAMLHLRELVAKLEVSYRAFLARGLEPAR